MTKDPRTYPNPDDGYPYPVNGVTRDAYAVEREAERLSAETIAWTERSYPWPNPPYPPVDPVGIEPVIQASQELVELCGAVQGTVPPYLQGELQQFQNLIGTWIVKFQPLKQPPAAAGAKD